MSWRSRITGDAQYELDEEIGKILDEPAPGEGAAVDAVRKSGGDEVVAKAAAVLLRAHAALVDAYGGRLPGDVRKAMGLPPRPKPKPKPKPAPAVAKADREEEFAAIVRKFEEREKQMGVDGLAKADREAADAFDEAVALVRKADTTLSREQAFVRVLDERPDLYASVQRAFVAKQAEDAAAVPPELETIVAEQARLAKAAALMRAAPGNEHLTDEQLIAKALDADPTLYGRE
jgi:hypothetical protein